MKVKCNINNINNFGDVNIQVRLKQYIKKSDGEIDLCLNKEYVVYGIVFWGNSPWYYLCSEEDDTYPKPFPNECFEVLDDNISRYWKLKIKTTSDNQIIPYLVFNEWASDLRFYEYLIDGDFSSEQIFGKYKKLIDSEQKDSRS